jgi:tetratricopeptide (TPR) repeat protein
MVAGAHFLLGLIASYLGQLEAAREHLELAADLFGPGPFRNFGEAQYAHFATATLTLTLLGLGYPAAALRKSRELLDALRRLADPASLAMALVGEASIYLLLRDSRTALERAEESLLIATEHGMRVFAAWATFYRGWALADEGRGQEGFAEMSRALPALEGNIGLALPAGGPRAMGRGAGNKPSCFWRLLLLQTSLRRVVQSQDYSKLTPPKKEVSGA